MGDCARLGFGSVPSNERTVAYTELFCNLAIAKRCAWFARFDFFNCFLDWVHIGGAMTRFVYVVVVVGCIIKVSVRAMKQVA